MSHGTISSKEGDQTKLDVEVSLTISRGSNQLTTWYGLLILPADSYIEPGLFELELDDGRVGDIIIYNAPVTERRVPFQGSGELKQP